MTKCFRLKESGYYIEACCYFWCTWNILWNIYKLIKYVMIYNILNLSINITILKKQSNTLSDFHTSKK